MKHILLSYQALFRSNLQKKNSCPSELHAADWDSVPVRCAVHSDKVCMCVHLSSQSQLVSQEPTHEYTIKYIGI